MCEHARTDRSRRTLRHLGKQYGGEIESGWRWVLPAVIVRVHHLPRIFAAPPGHPTASGFDSIEYMYEIFLNLINV